MVYDNDVCNVANSLADHERQRRTVHVPEAPVTRQKLFGGKNDISKNDSRHHQRPPLDTAVELFELLETVCKKRWRTFMRE